MKKHQNDDYMEHDHFLSVIKEYQKLIYKICYCYCSDPDNRKDLQQEILIQLWRSFGKYDGRVKMSTWIYRIALNTAISFYRSDCKHSKNKVTIDAEVIALPDDAHTLENDHHIQMLHRFISRLASFDKALILLYMDDRKYSDIAQILGITETNVATKINRIKQKLREQFNNH